PKLPPRSCDLTPLDFFLWGYLKSQVYVNKPTTTRALKEEIQRCINEIQPHLCKMVMENFDKRFMMKSLVLKPLQKVWVIMSSQAYQTTMIL
ncbi:hypothetical protein ALC56_00687, partial [Trachymyrmex septentrionalis]